MINKKGSAIIRYNKKVRIDEVSESIYYLECKMIENEKEIRRLESANEDIYKICRIKLENQSIETAVHIMKGYIDPTHGYAE